MEAIPWGFSHARMEVNRCQENQSAPAPIPAVPNCEEHAKLEARRYEKYDRAPETKRRYGRAWKRIRDSYVAAHPLCELCLKEGRYVKT